MSRKITIEFLGDSKDLQRAMGDADDKSSKLGGTLKKVGKAAAIGLGAGAVVAGAALVKMAQGAIEDDAAQAKLAKTLQNTAGATDKQVASVEKWISAQGKAFGVADDDLRPALEKLVTATGDVGEAQKLAALAMDVSAGTGKSLEQVTTALAKAQNGSVAGLTRLGIKTKDSVKDTAAMQAANIALTKAQDDYNEAVDTFGPKSKEAKDAAAALEYRQTKLGEANAKVKQSTIDFSEAQNRLNKAYGGQAADAAETLQGKMARLKLILAEAGETIGAKLIPVVTQMADWFLAKGLPAISAFGGWMSANLVPALVSVGQKVASITGFLNEHRTALAAAAVAVGALVAVTQIHAAVMAMQAAGGLAAMIKGLPVVTALTKVWTAVQWAANAALAANPIGLVVAALVALGVGLTLAWKHSETFRNVVTGALDKVRAAANAVANFFRNTLPDFFRDAWDDAKRFTTEGIERIREWVTGIPGKVSNALSSLRSTMGDLFSDAMEAGKEKVTGIGATILGWISEIPAKLREKISNFREAGAALIGGFVDGIKNAGGVIEGIAGNVWNAVRELLNGAINKINAALEFTINLPGKNISINAPDIPQLAKGGIVNSPTLALIGEDGPEAVVPLSRKHNPGGVMPGMGGGSLAPIVVQLMLPGGKVLEQLLIQHTRDSGRPLQIRTLGAF
jgi:phage-related protein